MEMLSISDLADYGLVIFQAVRSSVCSWHGLVPGTEAFNSG